AKPAILGAKASGSSHLPVPPALPTERIAHDKPAETAALRDFDPVYRFGVRSEKAQNEQMPFGLHPKRIGHVVCKRPITTFACSYAAIRPAARRLRSGRRRCGPSSDLKSAPAFRPAWCRHS